MAMFRKLRRGSKDSDVGGDLADRQDNSLLSPPATAATDKDKLTFFDLPAEIRNDIYDLVAGRTTLRLPVGKKREAPVIPGLLVASKQCRHEYLPLLYSTVPFLVEVRDFGFGNLTRVVSSLYRTELKAMRNNVRLVIQLRTQNCTRENLASLRRWLVARADGLDRLPWNYEIIDDGPVTDMGRIRLLRELEYYTRLLARLNGKLEETVQWELHAIIAAFEHRASMLQHDIRTLNKRQLGSPSMVRGLLGGGLR